MVCLSDRHRQHLGVTLLLRSLPCSQPPPALLGALFLKWLWWPCPRPGGWGGHRTLSVPSVVAEGFPEPRFKEKTCVSRSPPCCPPPPVRSASGVSVQGAVLFPVPCTPTPVNGAGPPRPGPCLCDFWRGRLPPLLCRRWEREGARWASDLTLGRGTWDRPRVEGGTTFSLQCARSGQVTAASDTVTRRRAGGTTPFSARLEKSPAGRRGAGGHRATHACSVSGSGRVGAGRPLQRVLHAGAGAGGARGAR